MGTLVGAIGKHSIGKDTPNEAVIKDRVQNLKDAWKSAVKAKKTSENTKDTIKREAQEESSSPSPAKKRKVDIEPKKVTSFTNLLKKVSGSPNGVVSTDNMPSIPKVHDKTMGSTSHKKVVALTFNETTKVSTNLENPKDEKQGKS
jgi:hypothetical protein